MGLGSLEEMEDYIKKWRLGLLDEGEKLTEDAIAENKKNYNAAVNDVIVARGKLKTA